MLASCAVQTKPSKKRPSCPSQYFNMIFLFWPIECWSSVQIAQFWSVLTVFLQCSVCDNFNKPLTQGKPNLTHPVEIWKMKRRVGWAQSKAEETESGHQSVNLFNTVQSQLQINVCRVTSFKRKRCVEKEPFLEMFFQCPSWFLSC